MCVAEPAAVKWLELAGAQPREPQAAARLAVVRQAVAALLAVVRSAVVRSAVVRQAAAELPAVAAFHC